MLLGKDRRGREHERLLAVDGDGERGANGDLGLAVTDVAAHEPVGRPRRFEVFLDRLDRTLLVGRLLVREARLELLNEVAVDLVGDALGALPVGVEGDELAGQLAAPARARDLTSCHALPPSFERAGPCPLPPT